MTKIYLVGPINGCTDSEANDWRTLIKYLLPEYEHLDPMRRDYRGREMDTGVSDEIVVGDIHDCEDCDVAIAYRPKPSDGSAMEQVILSKLNKPCIVIVPEGVNPSPWTVNKRFATLVVKTEKEAALWIKENFPK